MLRPLTRRQASRPLGVDFRIALGFLGVGSPGGFARASGITTRNYAKASNKKVPNLYPAAQLNGATPKE
jgi:hypothetical protein